MARFTLFPSTPEGKRRSVLFAIAVVTGFIAIVAATSAYVASPANLPVAATLIVAAAFAFAFAVLVFLGRFAWLVESDEPGEPREDREDDDPGDGPRA